MSAASANGTLTIQETVELIKDFLAENGLTDTLACFKREWSAHNENGDINSDGGNEDEDDGSDAEPAVRKERESMGTGGGATLEPKRNKQNQKAGTSKSTSADHQDQEEEEHIVDPEVEQLNKETTKALLGLLSDGVPSENEEEDRDDNEEEMAEENEDHDDEELEEEAVQVKTENGNAAGPQSDDDDDDFVRKPKKQSKNVEMITIDSDSPSGSETTEELGPSTSTAKGKKRAVKEESSDSDEVQKADKSTSRKQSLRSASRKSSSSKQPRAKKARVQIESDSDNESDTSTRSNSSSKNDVKPSKKVEDDSGDSDSDVIFESEVRPKNARTRKFLTNDKLEKKTVDAEKAEKERRKRLEQKQKEFNGIEFSNEHDILAALTGSQSTPRLKAVVVDPDTNGDPPCPVKVHPSLVKILKPHQAKGIQFLYDSAIESLDRLGEPGGGGILAHCMGLGKTLQVISFLHTILMHSKIGEVVKRVLVVVPKNVVRNWKNEFEKWLDNNDEDLATINVMELDSFKTNRDRQVALQNWYESDSPSVMIIGYEMFRILTQLESDLPVPKNGKPRKKRPWKEEKILEKCREFLQDPGPDLIVCDEAHKLKNDVSKLTRVMERIKTLRRLCLTGTPLQNNLLEYFVMVNFVKPGLLGTKQEFSNRFKNIIERGSKKDATTGEVKYMKKRCHVLYQKLKGCVDRKDSRVLVEAIPPKQEYVINVRMTSRQCNLYRAFLNHIDDAGIQLSKRVLPDYHILSRVWTHPHQLLVHEVEEERKRFVKGIEEFIDDGEGSGGAESGSDSDDDECQIIDDNEVDDEATNSTASSGNGTLARRSGRLAGKEPSPVADTPPEMRGWYAQENLVSPDDEHDYSLSNKLMLLIQIIKKCEEIGDKLLVFSQSLESLTLIKTMLEYFGENNRWFVDGHEAIKADGEVWSWKEGRDYLVIDGSVNTAKREAVQNQFNNHNDLRARLMLISTRAGSLGTNMVAANRVIIFDACWNPSHDTQSLFRVYRFGQTKPVYIYRFIAQGTMEERIYKRQVTKESTSKRVVDETALQNHFNGHELAELYQFDPDELEESEDSQESSQRPSNMAPPKDRMLADVILSHHRCIVNYIQHDSLFDHLEDEELSQEEMREAWDDYEQERERPHLALNNMLMGSSLPAGSNLPNYAAMIQRQQMQFQHQQHLQALRAQHQSAGAQLLAQARQRQAQATATSSAAATSNSNSSAALQQQQKQVLTNMLSDPVFPMAAQLTGADMNAVMEIIYLKNSLNELLPLIPEGTRGEVTDFNTYFMNAAWKAANFSNLMKQSKTIFNTVVRLCHNIDSCKALLNALYRRTPQYFEKTDWAFLH